MDSATGAQFPPTRWSLIVQAGSSVDPRTREQALEEICRSYWRPLYAFARHKGCPPQDAEDATQSFLAALLENSTIAAADSRAGSLPTFLLTRFQSFLVDSWRHDHAAKRGGNIVHLPLNFQDAESWCAAELQDAASPDAAFERQWVNDLLASVLLRVRATYESGGRAAQFDVLRPFLNFEDTGSDYTAASETLGSTPAAVRQAVHRLRERFARALRDHIAETLAAPSGEAIEEELAALRAVLAA